MNYLLQHLDLSRSQLVARFGLLGQILARLPELLEDLGRQHPADGRLAPASPLPRRPPHRQLRRAGGRRYRKPGGISLAHRGACSVTLDALLQELKARGIPQKAFAESIGMNSRHLSAVKSAELRNHFYNELGAMKLACLWVLEHFGKADLESLDK